MLVKTPWQHVVLADLRKLTSEPFFWFILVCPVLLGWGSHYALPFLAARVESFDLTVYYPVIVAMLILTPPIYYGFVLALLVLEEKDEGVLVAIAVTPLQLGKFVLARLLAYTLVSLPLIVVVHRVIGLVPVSDRDMALVALAAAPAAPFIAMLLSAYCKNQLEGFVMGKGMGFLVLFPLAMFFVPGHWHLLCGVLPTYWPIIAYYEVSSGEGSGPFFFVAVLVAIAYQLIAAYWLYQRVERQVKL